MASSTETLKSLPVEIQPQDTAVESAAEQLVTLGRARSKASQEKGWTAILTSAKKIVAARPNDHLSSILADLREVNISRKDPGRYYRVKDMISPFGANIMKRGGKAIDDKFSHPYVSDGQYSVGNVSPIRYLAGLIRPDTSAVVELGSGWGSNIFQLYIAHGATRSKKIIYYGGEYTKSGITCSKFLAAREPAMKFRAFAFDYRNPNIKFLSKQPGHILLFTSHSIEQVDIISPDLFEQLRQISNKVTFVHFEPVGWQSFPELAKRRADDDKEAFEKVGSEVVAGNLTSSVAENAAWWSWRLQYNTNLLPILKKLEGEGAIRMIRTAVDFGGVNVLNPSTLIHYEFVR